MTRVMTCFVRSVSRSSASWGCLTKARALHRDHPVFLLGMIWMRNDGDDYPGSWRSMQA